MKLSAYLKQNQNTSGLAEISAHRIPELDGVRGIAVLMVCMTHAFSGYMRDTGIQWRGIPKLVEAVSGFGWAGVDLFFVLSGFLITGILLDAKRDRHYFRNFYM